MTISDALEVILGCERVGRENDPKEGMKCPWKSIPSRELKYIHTYPTKREKENSSTQKLTFQGICDRFREGSWM